MKKKNTFLIYINNSIAFFIFSILRIFFKKKNGGSGYLFINTGQIGDLVISSIIFNNKDKFPNNEKVYFLMKNEYRTIYSDYNGRIQVIEWDYKKYKFNIIYRIKFLIQLRKENFFTCANITTARGITNDELSILSGAENVYCFQSNWRYLKKLFGRKMDGYYDKVFGFENSTEIIKQQLLIEHLLNKSIKCETRFYLSSNTKKKVYETVKSKFNFSLAEDYIVIAPFTDIEIKNWGIENFKRLTEYLTGEVNYNIILIGDEYQFKKLELIKNVSPQKIINTAGTFSINESAVIVQNSNLFIGNDSGFTHIAKAFNIPLIGIIGGGAWNSFFPYKDSGSDVLLYEKLDCFGCEWHCKFSTPHCIADVPVQVVIDSAEQILQNLN